MLDTRKKQGKEFYQNLGRLFYAVALADHSIHIQEIERLKEVVREHWLDVDDIKDEYGNDAAFQIETIFNQLLEYGQKADGMFQEFKDFYVDHKTLFPTKIKQLIKLTARAISSAFAGNNKSELIMLGRIELLFNE